MENNNYIGATTNKINVENGNNFYEIKKLIPNTKNEILEICEKLNEFVKQNFRELFLGAVKNIDFKTAYNEESEAFFISAYFKDKYFLFEYPEGIVKFCGFELEHDSYNHYRHCPTEEQLICLIEFINELIDLTNKPVLSKIKISFE